MLPFLITGVIFLHLIILHTDGSSAPTVSGQPALRLTFHPYFSYKDAFIFTVYLGFFGLLLFYAPNFLGHSDNFIPANPLVTPAHIVPEWYFTPFYAILRACPHKLGGAIGMFAAILLLFALPIYVLIHLRFPAVISSHSICHKAGFWAFIGVFFTLIFLGSNPAAEPYVTASRFFTIAYFVYFLLWIPITVVLAEVYFLNF